MSDRTRGSPATSLHLVVPNLAGPVQFNGQPVPDLVTFELALGRADLSRSTTPKTLEQLSFDLFGAAYDADEDLPVAAVTRVLDLGVVDKNWWIRADPVHLKPEGGRLILIPGRLLDIRPEEAQSMAAEIAEAYVGQGWLIKAPRPDRWYLKPPRAPKISTAPLSIVAGHDIDPYLPQGRDGMAWHGLLTEMQILLHTANANTAREHRGVPPINSLWFWGGGRLPKIQSSAWARIWSEEPVSLALARLSETPTAGIPASFSDWQRAASARGAHLVVFDQYRLEDSQDELTAWSNFMQSIDRLWIAPALEALRTESLSRLEIISDSGHRFTLGPRQLRRWWVRRRRLRSLR